MVFFLLLRPIDDPDIFTQVKLGELILDQGSLITNDSFTYSLSDVRIPSIGWLAQVMFALLYRFYSWTAVQCVHVLLYSGAFVIAAMSPSLDSAKKRGDISLFSLAAAVLLAFLVSLNNSSVRPQSFAFFCFSSLLYVLQSNWHLRTKLLALIPVVLLWQNTHPSLIIGICASAIMLLSSCLATFNNPDAAKPWGLLFLLVIIVLAQLATPMGWHLFEIQAQNALVSHEWVGVTEWLPPWHEAVRITMLAFWIALAITVGLITKLKGKVRFADLSMFGAFTVLTLYACRFAVFWSLVMVPIWAMWIEQAKPATFFSWRGNRQISIQSLVATFVIGVIIIGFSVPILRPSIIDQKSVPIQGIGQLKSVFARGRIYNWSEYGGPLSFAAYPNWQVTVDGRLYLYNKAFWENYIRTAYGKIPLQEIIKRHKPDAFFLQPGFHHELIAMLRRSQDWREFYADRMCVIFLPSKSEVTSAHE